MTAAPRLLDVSIPLASEAVAEWVRRALAVESDSVPPRTRVRVERVGSELRLHLEADDTRTLRAATNSFLRWAATAVAVAQTAQGRGVRPSKSV